jgi:Uncharacterized conserved protein
MSETAKKVETTLRRAKAVAGKSDSAVRQEFDRFVADLEDLIHSTTDLSGDELASARQKIGERVSAAKASLQNMSGEVAEHARETARATDEFVHEQPWKSIGLGAGVGFLLGMLVSRR